MLKLPKSLTVQYHGTKVGVLSMSPDNSRCMFEYDKGWIANGFSISPLELPLRTGLQAEMPLGRRRREMTGQVQARLRFA